MEQGETWGPKYNFSEKFHASSCKLRGKFASATNISADGLLQQNATGPQPLNTIFIGKENF